MALRQSVVAPTQFRDLVIHELSQPVTALQGSLEVALLRGNSQSEYREAIEVALQQANRLVTLLEELRERSEVA